MIMSDKLKNENTNKAWNGIGTTWYRPVKPLTRLG